MREKKAHHKTDLNSSARLVMVPTAESVPEQKVTHEAILYLRSTRKRALMSPRSKGMACDRLVFMVRYAIDTHRIRYPLSMHIVNLDM